MVGDLITLPLRLSLRTATFFLRSSEGVLKRALALSGRTVSAEAGYSARATNGRADTFHEPPATAPTAATTTAREPIVQPEPAVHDEPTPLVEEPAHVSEEPTIVEEFAEPGAEEGAGAQVRIQEPWEGYANMSAKQVISRIADASAAELAAINLYESAHHARQTVLSAAEQQLKLINRDGASD